MYQVDDIVSDAADHLLSAAARNAVGATDLAGKISLAVGSYLDAATTLRTQSNPMLSKLNAATALCQAAASPAELPVTQLQAIDRYVAPEVTRQKIPGLTLGVYRHGHAVLLKGYGFSNIEHDVPAAPDTVILSAKGNEIIATSWPVDPFGEQSANTTARIRAAASPVTSASETQPTTAASTRDTIISVGSRPVGTFPESVQNRYGGS